MVSFPCVQLVLLRQMHLANLVSIEAKYRASCEGLLKCLMNVSFENCLELVNLGCNRRLIIEMTAQ